MSKHEIEREYGYLKDIIGGGCWDLTPGEVTDDTMMTIAVAEGILENPENPVEHIGKHFIKWYDSKPKDIGNIIRIALSEYKRSNDWMKTANLLILLSKLTIICINCFILLNIIFHRAVLFKNTALIIYLWVRWGNRKLRKTCFISFFQPFLNTHLLLFPTEFSNCFYHS